MYKMTYSQPRQKKLIHYIIYIAITLTVFICLQKKIDIKIREIFILDKKFPN